MNLILFAQQESSLKVFLEKNSRLWRCVSLSLRY